MQPHPPASRLRIHPFMLLLATAVALGCAVDSTAPPSAPLHPRLNAAAKGQEFPNVVRFQDQFAVSIQDDKTDLVAIAGLPDDPTQAAICGGDEPYATVDFQDAGVRDGVIQSIGKGNDLNIDVYQRSTFISPCVSIPIAEGKGRLSYVDNDVFLTGDGGASWGFHFGGWVTLTDGSTAHLLAHNRFQVLPDGTFRRVFRQVKLN